MSKLTQAFLSGVFFTFFIDFFLFVGIKKTYIDLYEIDIYYNILFADNQNIYLFTLFTIFFGFLVTYVENAKLSIIVIGTLFILSFATLIQPIGHTMGTILLMKKNITLYDSKFTYNGDVYYEGRKTITFYDYEVQKILTLNKKDLRNVKN